MDQYMINIASLLSDWQQSAINDTRYSVVLILLTALICGLLGFFVVKIKVNRLQNKLTQAKDDLDYSDKERDKLLSDKEKEVELRLAIEQQLDQVSAQLQENEQILSQQKQVEEQQTRKLAENEAKLTALKTKLETELEALRAQLNDKTEFIEKQQLARQFSEQSLMAENQKEASQFAHELDVVKQQLQQLEAELTIKNEKIEEYEKLEQSANKNEDGGAGLESKLEKQNRDRDLEINQEQLDTLKNKVKQLEQEKQDAETKVAQSFELQNTIQKQQLIQLNKKLETFLSKSPSLKQEESDTEGVVDKAFKLFSSKDNDDKSHTDELSTQDAWQTHQTLINRVIDKLAAQAKASIQQAGEVESDEDMTAINALKETINEQQNHIARLQYDLEIKKLLINDKHLNLQGIPAEIIEKQQADQARIEALEQKLATGKSVKLPVDISGQLEEVTETVDHFQEKIKSLYHKYFS